MLRLRQKKFRQKYNKFIVEGEKIAGEVLAQRFYQVFEVYSTIEGQRLLRDIGQPPPFPITQVTAQEMKDISLLTTPTDILMVVDIPSPAHTAPEQPLILYLDGIQDPGNMGTILRIADWFGIVSVYGDDTCVDVYNPKVIQSGMGAFLRVFMQELALPELMRQFPNHIVYGASMEGENLFDTTLSPAILVIGSEGRGISPIHASCLQRRIRIPGSGAAESLNAAVATGILVSRFYEKLMR